MRLARRHDWNLSPAAARALQAELAAQVDVARPLDVQAILDGGLVAAADASFDRGGTEIYAAVVVCQAPSWTLVERIGVAAPMTFPYVPGLLSFREAPSLLMAFERLENRPDVVLCDGQGIAHPRRLGIASHLGLWLDLPTVGCAKSRLCGVHAEPGAKRGDATDLIDHEEVIGRVVRSRARVKPLFVSPGHLCDLAGAVELVLGCTSRLRLPIPSRMAHMYVNEVRRAVTAGLPIPS